MPSESETRTVYEIIKTNFPAYEIKLESLNEGQLERLARGEPPEKVLEPTQYKLISQERTFTELTRSQIIPAIGNHYSSKGESRAHSLKTNSPRRGVNPRGD